MADLLLDAPVVTAKAPDSPGAPARRDLPAGPDELVLEAGGQRLAGWREVRVQRSCEAFPAAFDIGLTEKYPAIPRDVAVAPGQVCRVRIGGDLVLTGYVDRYMPRIAATQHTVQIVGRSACEDLRDCTVIWDGNQISGASVREVAAKLAAPYGVKVGALDGDGMAIPQLNINLGETPYDVIERLARVAGMLVYDDQDGNLVLARVGTSRHSGGFVQGGNVLWAGGAFAFDERYSEYHAYLMATSAYGADLSAGAPQAGNEKAVVYDDGMAGLKRPDGQKRVRKLAIITEQNLGGQSLAVLRATWEMTRRAGRSQAVRLACDSWRDSEGRLWEPNWRVKVDLPALKVGNQEMVIADVSYLRDAGGTRAELLLMPPGAFAVEPTPLYPFNAQLQQELDTSRAKASVTDRSSPNFNPRANEPAGGF